jgi:hypothetical protein
MAHAGRHSRLALAESPVYILGRTGKVGWHSPATSKEPQRYPRQCSPPEIVGHAVSPYHRIGLSFRDVEDLPAEHVVIVSCEAMRHWCAKFGPCHGRRLAAGMPSRRR